MSEFSRSLAVVIGIDKYSNGIDTLQTAVNDATEVALILEKEHKYDQVWRLLDEEASLQALQQFLAQVLVEHTQAGDRLLFYFAGHGIALNGDEGPEGYLIPQDAKLNDTNSYLPMTKLQTSLSKLPCRHFLGILDCCFAGAFRWSSTRDLLPVPEVIHKERYDRFIADPAWQAITSAAYDQKALDSLTLNTDRGQTGHHSPFAAALIKALSGEADVYPPAAPGKPAGDGVITATELYLYLRDQIEPATEGVCRRQTPGIWPLKKHDKGEYIFLSPGHALNLPSAPDLDASKNPYRGLESYDEEHSELFFGRTELVEKLQTFVKAHPLTVVLGASGSGKSSLVKAGLIPELRKKTTEKWFILPPVRPDETPLRALNNALKNAQLPEIATQNPQQNLDMSIDVWAKNNPNSQLLLFIDQSEEIITLCKNEDERKEFFQQILKAINVHRDKLRVILSLRSDFEPQVRDAGLKFVPTILNLGNTKLKNRWKSGRFIVPAMTRGELREAIEKPAETLVMYFQPYELVEKLIDEVADMPGGLPLLSFALSELYLKYLKRQQDAQNGGITIDRALTQDDYQDLGGVIGSLTQRADEEYEALVKEDPYYAQIIRNVMLRMVALGGGELARRRVPLSELEYPAEKSRLVKAVIDCFTEARLLVQGEDAEGNPYVEPAHDALVRGWQKLLMWNEKEEGSLLLQRRLTPAAEEWESVKNNNKEQPKGILDKADPIWDWLDRRLFTVENLVNKIPVQLARLLRCSQNQAERLRDKPKHFLWNANPYLDVLAKELNSNDTWLNQVEAEFVQQSAWQKRQNTSWRWRIAIIVMLSLSGLTSFAFYQLRNALDKNVNTLAETSEAFLLSNRQLEALVAAVQSGKQSQNPMLFLDPATRQTASAALQRAVYNVQEHNRLEGHSDSVTSVVFSPDGKTLASASIDGTVKLWSIDGRELKRLPGQNQSFRRIIFSPDGKMIAAISANNTIKAWNIDGQELITLNGKSSADNFTSSLCISPDGKVIAAPSEGNTVKLWSTSGQELKVLKGHQISVWSVSCSSDGKTIVTADQGGFVKIWSTDGRELKTFRASKLSIYDVSFSPDGKSIATAAGDTTVKLWSLDGQEIRTLGKHDNYVTSVSFSPDGKTIASTSADRTVKLWRSATGQEIKTFRGHNDTIFSVSFSPNGKFIASAAGDNTVKLWSIDDEQKLKTFVGHSDSLWSVGFSPNGKIIASAGDDKTIRLWSLDGQELRTIKADSDKPWNRIRSLSFSPDGNTIATSNDDTTIKLWNLDGQNLKTFKGHKSEVTDVSFSPNGRTLASASYDGTVKLWPVEGQESRTLKASSGKVLSVSFSPDGKTLASAHHDGTVKLWNLQGQLLRTIPGHGSDVKSVRFSPDGKIIASASRDQTVKLWSLEGQELKTLKGHSAEVTKLSFSPDSKILASSSADGTIRLWSVTNGQDLKTFQGHGYPYWDVNFSPDGKKIVSVSDDALVELWNAETLNEEQLIDQGCNWLHDYLKNNSNVAEKDKHICDRIKSGVSIPH